MKIANKVLPLLGILAAAFVASADAPRVTRQAIVAMERNLDERITRLWDDNPVSVVGFTRGIYLEGYGAVFTAEVNMVAQPQTLMNPILTPADKAIFQKKKRDRLPQLKKALVQALVATASSLDPVPSNEQVVISVSLTRYQWEDPTGTPAQIIVQAQKSKLVEAQRQGGSGWESAVKVTEN
jgi:hypothetical protein